MADPGCSPLHRPFSSMVDEHTPPRNVTELVNGGAGATPVVWIDACDDRRAKGHLFLHCLRAPASPSLVVIGGAGGIGPTRIRVGDLDIKQDPPALKLRYSLRRQHDFPTLARCIRVSELRWSSPLPPGHATPLQSWPVAHGDSDRKAWAWPLPPRPFACAFWVTIGAMAIFAPQFAAHPHNRGHSGHGWYPGGKYSFSEGLLKSTQPRDRRLRADLRDHTYVPSTSDWAPRSVL